MYQISRPKTKYRGKLPSLRTIAEVYQSALISSLKKQPRSSGENLSRARGVVFICLARTPTCDRNIKFGAAAGDVAWVREPVLMLRPDWEMMAMSNW